MSSLGRVLISAVLATAGCATAQGHVRAVTEVEPLAKVKGAVSTVRIQSQLGKCDVSSDCRKFISKSYYTVEQGAEDGFLSDLGKACGDCEFLASVEQTYDDKTTDYCGFSFGTYLAPYKFSKTKVMSKFWAYVNDVTCTKEPKVYVAKKAGSDACKGSTDLGDFATAKYDGDGKLIKIQTKKIWDLKDIAIDLTGCKGSFHTTAGFNLKLKGAAGNFALGLGTLAALAATAAASI